MLTFRRRSLVFYFHSSYIVKMLVAHISAIFLYLFVIEQVICQQSDCSIADGSIGVCVQIDECPSLVHLFRPLRSHVVNVLKNYTCAFDLDRRTLKVCCLDDNLSTEGTATSTPSTKLSHRIPSSSSSTTTRTTEPDLLEDTSMHPNLNLLPLTTCGEVLDPKRRKAYTVNVNNTNLFQFPWMALLLYEKDLNIESLCSGSLISARYVLTAGQCVKVRLAVVLVAVRLGEYDTTTDIDCQVIGQERICAPAVQDIPVEEAVPHPMFNRPKYANDIAIVRLAREADITPESVRPICLPTTSQVQSTVLKKVLVTGWSFGNFFSTNSTLLGLGVSEVENLTNVLWQALMPIIPNDFCQGQYKRSVQLTAGQMCAGGEPGISTCKGDSGGPLMYPASLDTVRMVQFGIVSAGVSVCTYNNKFPGIEVKVAYYMRWILDQIRP